jgi:hypothetical protein
VVGFEDGVGGGVEEWGFVEVKADAVAGRVEATSGAAVNAGSAVALSGEEIENGLVDLAGWDAGAEEAEGDLLGGSDGAVEAMDGVGGASADDGAGDIAVVAGLLGAREDVEDDGLVGVEGAEALLVGIGGLAGRGDDGVGGGATGLEDGDLNNGAETFGGEGEAAMEEASAGADPGVSESLDGLGHTDFGHDQGGADLLDLDGGLGGAFREEDGTRANSETEFKMAELAGEAKGEGIGDDPAPDLAAPGDVMDEVGEGGAAGVSADESQTMRVG